MIKQSNIELFTDAETLARSVIEGIKNTCEEAVKERGVFHFALAGGTTPKRCYELLAAENLPWHKCFIYFGDERCLAVGDAERNDTMARNVWLNQVSIPGDQIYSMPAELGPNEGAEQYLALLEQAPQLDLILLGLGEDGHTASLFPNNLALQNERAAVPVFDSPKPPSERISMSKHYINTAREKWFIVTGSGKRDAMAKMMNGEPLPATLITGARWLVEDASMPEGDK
ncbi:MAG: 6-phosphogluconolactonase [Gammaproteobacteria bacterium]|nr:MAG: 6-phosphogluconolactonase [Gammaproteobacteria bacterium]